MAKTRKRADGEQSLSEASYHSDTNSETPPSGTADDTQQDAGGADQIRGAEQASGQRSPDRIAARAYELYLARGGSDGGDFEDWLAAERELASTPPQGDRDE
jgi:hypothetical protein